MFLAGILLGLAHPPLKLFVPSFIALAPFIVWHERLPDTPGGARQARVGGFFLGLVYFTLVFYWLIVALIFYTPWAIGAFLGPVIIMSWFLAGMSGAIHQIRRRIGWPVWLTFPVCWVATEWFRSNLPDVGFPWMQIGDTLAYYPQIIGHADLVGSRGLSFWLVSINTLVALLWLARRPGPEGRAGRTTPLVAALAAVVLVPIGYSLVRWNTIEMRPAATVGVVQPNVPEHLKIEDRDEAGRVAMATTDSIVAGWRSMREQIDLVLLPESAIPQQLEAIPSMGYPASTYYENWWLSLGESLDAAVALGALGVEDDGESFELFNSAFVSAPGVGRVGRYDKRFLVPVVERVPFLDPSWFSGLTYFGSFGVGDWSPPFSLDTNRGRSSYGIMICYESIFSPLSRHYRRNGAEFLVNLTNDAWFGRDEWWSRSSALWQHPAHLVMRAVESRMGVARSANTGVSEIVDPLGRVSNATPLFEPAGFVGDVMTTDVVTIYVRFGDVTGWLSVIAAMGGVGVSLYRRRRGVA